MTYTLTDYDTIALLKAAPKPTQGSDPIYAYAHGYWARKDGGEGVFYWNSTSTATDNGGTVLITTAGGTGRWIRRYSGPLDAKWFGAKGDNTQDDTTYLQNWISQGGELYLPAGTYKITASLNMVSNTSVLGAANAIISVAANSVYVFYAISKTDIRIEGVEINGNGSTGTSGYRDARGIEFDAVTNFHITDCHIHNMGNMNASPQSDSGYAGYGIIALSYSGICSNGLIEHCTVSTVAGGGVNNGDGICVLGMTYEISHITIKDCWVSTCGRHCYTLASGASVSPSYITIVGCYAEKSSLCGIDFEPGIDTAVTESVFDHCGNDQTFYNPAIAFGSTYRLLSGITLGDSCDDVIVRACTFKTCYYGINYGPSANPIISDCEFFSSTTSDMYQGLSNGGTGIRLLNCTFNSTSTLLTYYRAQGTYPTTSPCNFLAQACVFAGPVKMSGVSDATFKNCTFKAGFVTDGFEVFGITWDGCEFRNFTGVGIDFNTSGQFASDCVVTNCRFRGTGNMTYGIRHNYHAAKHWSITNNEFIGLTTAGIYISNGDAQEAYSNISGNTFRSCAAGISITQAVNNAIIANNYFVGNTGYCIEITAIAAGAAMAGTQIIGNTSGSSCTNGLRITLNGGSWDYCAVLGNNMHSASGTKWSLAAGNGNGSTANNVTT